MITITASDGDGTADTTIEMGACEGGFRVARLTVRDTGSAHRPRVDVALIERAFAAQPAGPWQRERPAPTQPVRAWPAQGRRSRLAAARPRPAR